MVIILNIRIGLHWWCYSNDQSNKEVIIPSKTIILIFCSVLLVECTEPVRPEFDFKSGLVSVEGFVSTTPGGSFVRINELNEFNVGTNSYENVFISGAEVSFINTDTGNEINLTEDEEAEIYIPPVDFAGTVGNTWELTVSLVDGRVYRSFPETIVESVVISTINATYNPELTFNVELDDFAPGHSIAVGFEDPSEGENYYYWSFRSFELKDICMICYGSHIYREDTCIPVDPFPYPPDEPVPFYTYLCENDCWRIRYNQNIKIFSDKFSNGLKVAGLPAADVLLHTKRDILVEVQQFSLSAAAYEYYETLKDIVDDNGGFNSPPSAALIGNMFNPNNTDEFVLGRFTAASNSTANIFIDRSNIEESQLETEILFSEEMAPPPGIAPEDWVFYIPCPRESRYNTSIRPEGWQ